MQGYDVACHVPEQQWLPILNKLFLFGPEEQEVALALDPRAEERAECQKFSFRWHGMAWHGMPKPVLIGSRDGSNGKETLDWTDCEAM